ncbi:MAG: hypothetical protein B6D63_01590 [Candidatus Latescibacteria bacterium 4484_7]|nr:MAG: hypothetical protein B6D63_01590 [Candidatus Latescibacteria bacterium 4484_7]
MEKARLKRLLERVAKGELSIEKAYEQLLKLPFEDMGYAKVDHHRAIRRGIPEVIMCEGKKGNEVVGIAKGVVKEGGNLLATRCSRELFELVSREIPHAVYHDEARLFAVEQRATERRGKVAVVSAGTSDMNVAEEAAFTAHYLGCNVERFYDVGVAGIHRLFSSWDEIRSADVIVVVAGMEGALASVVAGKYHKQDIRSGEGLRGGLID